MTSNITVTTNSYANANAVPWVIDHSAKKKLHDKHDHAVALGNYLKEDRSVPYEWGTCDCALFAVNGIRAMLGVDIASDFRGKYSNANAAFATISTVTGIANATVADAAIYCANKHGLKELPNPMFAQRGDLVVYADNEGHLSAGLIGPTGRHIVAKAEVGHHRISITAVKRAWRITSSKRSETVADRWAKIRGHIKGRPAQGEMSSAAKLQTQQLEAGIKSVDIDQTPRILTTTVKMPKEQ